MAELNPISERKTPSSIPSGSGKVKFRGVVEDIRKILKQIELSPFSEGFQTLVSKENQEESNVKDQVQEDVFSSQFLLKLCLQLQNPTDLKSFSLVNKKWNRMHGNIKRSIKVLEWDFLESGRMKRRFPNLIDIDLAAAWNSKKRENKEYDNFVLLSQKSFQMKIFLDSKFPEKYELKTLEEQNDLFVSLQKSLLFVSEDYPKLQKLSFVDFHGHFTEEILANIFESRQKRSNNFKNVPNSPSFRTPSKKFPIFQNESPRHSNTIKNKYSNNNNNNSNDNHDYNHIYHNENGKNTEQQENWSELEVKSPKKNGFESGQYEKKISEDKNFSGEKNFSDENFFVSEQQKSGSEKKKFSENSQKNHSYDQNSFEDPFLEYNGMEMIAKKCEFLQELKIWQCNDNTLESVCKCSNIQILHLMDSIPGLNLNPVSDWGLILLSESCKRLMELYLGSGSIGYEGLSAIGKNCQIISKLTVCNKEFRKGWLRALSHFTMLETLCFENCHKIDLDPGPMDKLGNCFSIGRLQFLNCDLGDQHGFHALMKMCSPTKEIEFRDCWRLTDDIFLLITFLKNLRILQMDGCSLITSKGLENVLIELPSIQILKILFCEKIIEKEVSTKLSIRLSNLKKLIWQPQSGGDNLKTGQKITFGTLI